MLKIRYVIGTALALAAVHAHAAVLALVGGTIIDGNGGTPIENGVIVIEGKRIVAVGDRSTQIPPRAKRVSATGKFIIPGLMDTAVYLVGDYEPANSFIRYEGRFDELAIEGAQMALKFGVTTVFAVWGPRDDLIKARDAIDQGKVPGSRIYVAGNVIGYGGPYSDDFGLGGVKDLNEVVTDRFTERINARFTQNVGAELTLMSPEEVREEIRKYVHSGVDFLTVAATSHHFGAGRYFVFSPRVLHAIVEEAHAAGLPVMSYKLDNIEALDMQIEAGVDVLTQCELASGPRPYTAERVAWLASRQTPCPIGAFSKETLAFLLTNFPVGSFAKVVEAGDSNARALIGAGAMTMMITAGGLFGPDQLKSSFWKGYVAPNGDTPAILGENHFHWLLNVQAMGMKPMTALMSATRNVAQGFKVGKDLGTLERGKLADLVVLDKNPLESAQNYRNISLVIKDGAVVNRDALPTQRLLTAGGLDRHR